MHKREIQKLRNKKNILLFGVLFSALILGLFYFFAFKYEFINRNILDGIYLFVVIGFFIAVIKIKDVVGYTVFKYNYLLMIDEDLPPIKTKRAIFTEKWEESFLEEGFILHTKNASFSIYYQITDRHSEYKGFGKSLFCVVVNKVEKLDLYNSQIQNEIKEIYSLNEKKYSRLKKEFVVQFKKYKKFDDNTKKELQKILNFKQDSFSIINLTVGYFEDSRKVYYLRPERRFPNKYYFLICKFIENYI